MKVIAFLRAGARFKWPMRANKNCSDTPKNHLSNEAQRIWWIPADSFFQLFVAHFVISRVSFRARYMSYRWVEQESPIQWIQRRNALKCCYGIPIYLANVSWVLQFILRSQICIELCWYLFSSRPTWVGQHADGPLYFSLACWMSLIFFVSAFVCLHCTSKSLVNWLCT